MLAAFFLFGGGGGGAEGSGVLLWSLARGRAGEPKQLLGGRKTIGTWLLSMLCKSSRTVWRTNRGNH